MLASAGVSRSMTEKEKDERYGHIPYIGKFLCGLNLCCVCNLPEMAKKVPVKINPTIYVRSHQIVKIGLTYLHIIIFPICGT